MTAAGFANQAPTYPQTATPCVDNCVGLNNFLFQGGNNAFKAVTTDFKTFHVIADENNVVINGTAEFLRNNKRVSFVSACDIYAFNAEGQVQQITSYCIQRK